MPRSCSKKESSSGLSDAGAINVPREHLVTQSVEQLWMYARRVNRQCLSMRTLLCKPIIVTPFSLTRRSTFEKYWRASKASQFNSFQFSVAIKSFLPSNMEIEDLGFEWSGPAWMVDRQVKARRGRPRGTGSCFTPLTMQFKDDLHVQVVRGCFGSVIMT